MTRLLIGLITLLWVILPACNSGQTSDAAAEVREKGDRYPLPYLGPRDVSESGDTLFFQIPPYGFVDQDSNLVTEQMTDGRVYVADFFFTTCPSICPKMSQQMLRVHDEFLEEDRLILLSHTIDPAHDTVGVLKEYAQALEVQTARWHMVTGEKDSLYNMARHYMVSAMEDEDAPGGFIHSGAFILLDTERHIRGYYDGTKAEEVDQLMEDIQWLLAQGKE